MSKNDAGKIRFSLIPAAALERVAAVFTSGSEGRADRGWRDLPDAATRYHDALLRHASKAAQGEAKDPHSGESHWAHVAANALIMLDLAQRAQPSEIETDARNVYPIGDTYIGPPLRPPRPYTTATRPPFDGPPLSSPRPLYPRETLESAREAANSALAGLLGTSISLSRPLDEPLAAVLGALADAGLPGVVVSVTPRGDRADISLGGYLYAALLYDQHRCQVEMIFLDQELFAEEAA